MDLRGQLLWPHGHIQSGGRFGCPGGASWAPPELPGIVAARSKVARSVSSGHHVMVVTSLRQIHRVCAKFLWSLVQAGASDIALGFSGVRESGEDA